MLAVLSSHALEGGRCEERLRAGHSLTVRLTHIDGKLPNMALMRLAAFHRERGDNVVLTGNVCRGAFEPEYDVVYGSAIFSRSIDGVRRLCQEFPGAIVGGTGLIGAAEFDWTRTVEEYLDLDSYEKLDYSIYDTDKKPFTASLGMTQRGCRMNCTFCRVPEKEGRPRSTNTIWEIWRGEPHPRHIHLLDNDFFGQPEAEWRARIDEMNEGDFRVSLTQGINVRLVDPTIAKAIATIPYYADNFDQRRLYMAWDNMKDEKRFLAGITHLLDAGIKPSHCMVYMLCGYDPNETWERIFHRYETMKALGLMPFPMVYEKAPKVTGNGLPYRRLKDFQRWVLRYANFIPWERYHVNGKGSLAAMRHQLHMEFRDELRNPAPLH